MKFKLEPYHRNVNDNDLIADLKRVSNRINNNHVSQHNYNKYGIYNSATLIRRFGSWNRAIEKAKLKITKYHDIPENDLIKDLRRVADLLNKDAVTVAEYKLNGVYSITPFQRKFGSWFNALEKAGLNKTRNLGISDEDYFENIERVWTKLGRQPRYKEMIKPLSTYSGHAYEHRFGSWRKALEQFIEYINQGEISIISERDREISNSSQSSENEMFIHKTSRTISWRLRFIIMKRDNFKCKICGKSPATDPKTILEVDHVIPWSRGGETVPDNLQTLCRECNIGKSDLEM